jgi:disulfide bond formation protein DsbB
MTDFMQVFSSVMGLVVLCAGLLTIVSMLVPGAAWTGHWRSAVGESRGLIVCTITWGAMLGSLYFSEIANYEPCKLCWYQRIAMYSMAFISLTALVLRDRSVSRYTLVLAAVGLPISLYHYLLEWIPTLESNVCSVSVPCTTIWFREFGFVTLSFIAGSSFITIIALSILGLGSVDSSPSESET